MMFFNICIINRIIHGKESYIIKDKSYDKFTKELRIFSVIEDTPLRKNLGKPIIE